MADRPGNARRPRWGADGTAAGPCTATTVKYDFLKLLLGRLNKGKKRYRVGRGRSGEFDFEAPADYDGNRQAPAGPGAEHRRPPDDARRDPRPGRAGVKTSNAESGNFNTLLIGRRSRRQGPGRPAAGSSVDATVRGSRKFHFVDTHLEAFDRDPCRASARAAGEASCSAPGGPASRAELPVILVGDLNSDDNTVSRGDGQAYRRCSKARASARRAPTSRGLLHRQHPTT